MNNILVKVGGEPATQASGNPPAASSDPAAPVGSAGTGTVTTKTASESTAAIPVSFQGNGAICAIFAKIGGANTYLNANVCASGKAAKSGPVSGSGQTFVITVQLKRDFDEGDVCFDISGQDAAGLVSLPVRTCLDLVKAIPVPLDDQPAAAAFGNSLAGTWISPCRNFSGSGGSPQSLKTSFTFGSGTSYTEALEQWSVADCPGSPDSGSLPVVSGTYLTGQDQFVNASELWAKDFDFVPDTQSGQLPVQTCFNLLRLEPTADEISFGIPIGFSVTGAQDSPGSCISAASRPTFLTTGEPFTRVIPSNLKILSLTGAGTALVERNYPLTVVVDNTGNQAVSAVLGYYFRFDTANPPPAPDPQQRYGGGTFVFAPGQHEYHTGVTYHAANQQTATYDNYLQFFVDDSNTVAETNETDNAGPILHVVVCGPSDSQCQAQADPGQPVTKSAPQQTSNAIAGAPQAERGAR